VLQESIRLRPRRLTEVVTLNVGALAVDIPPRLETVQTHLAPGTRPADGKEVLMIDEVLSTNAKA
jgi:hypothetical protein